MSLDLEFFNIEQADLDYYFELTKDWTREDLLRCWQECLEMQSALEHKAAMKGAL